MPILMKNGFSKAAAGAAVALSMALAVPAQAQQQQAGVSAAVRGTVQLARAGAVGRQIASAEPIFLDDGITSGSRSGMQIILMDESVFTIGPDSDLEIDEFVYDPGEGTGSIVANFAKGTMRFVTGKIAAGKPENMKIKLPVGTIGIRGTVGLIEVLTPEEAQAKFPEQTGELFGNGGGQAGAPVVFAALVGPGANNNAGANVGSFNFTTPDGSVDLSRPNAATLATPGVPPVFFIAPPGTIQDVSAGLNGQGGGDDGDSDGDSQQQGENQSDGDGTQQADGQSEGDGSNDQQASSEDGGNQQAEGSSDGSNGGGGNSFQAASNSSGQAVGQSLTGATQIGGVLNNAGEGSSAVDDLASSGSVSNFTFSDVLGAAAGASSASASGSLSGSIAGNFNTFVSFSNRTFDIQFSSLSGGGVDNTSFAIAGGNVGFSDSDPAAVFVSNISNSDGFVNASATGCSVCEAKIVYTGTATANIEITTTSGGSGSATATYN